MSFLQSNPHNESIHSTAEMSHYPEADPGYRQRPEQNQRFARFRRIGPFDVPYQEENRFHEPCDNRDRHKRQSEDHRGRYHTSVESPVHKEDAEQIDQPPSYRSTYHPVEQ